MSIRSFLEALRQLWRDAREARPSEYRDGYVAALEDVQELAEEELEEFDDDV